jgi:hypothetical protein
MAMLSQVSFTFLNYQGVGDETDFGVPELSGWQQGAGQGKAGDLGVT